MNGADIHRCPWHPSAGASTPCSRSTPRSSPNHPSAPFRLSPAHGALAESRRRCFDDRPRRDPWHPSAAGCDPRSTAAAPPRSPCSICQSALRMRLARGTPLRADDRDPWHPSAAGWHPRSTAAACPRSRCYPGRRRKFPTAVPRCAHRRPMLPRAPPKFSESRRRSVDDRPRRDPWHPSAAGCDHRSTAAACPCSRSYPGRRRDFQSPALRSVDDRR